MRGTWLARRPMALAKGQSKSVTVPFAQASGRKYLRVRADVNKAIKERNEANNLWDDADTCIH